MSTLLPAAIVAAVLFTLLVVWPLLIAHGRREKRLEALGR